MQLFNKITAMTAMAGLGGSLVLYSTEPGTREFETRRGMVTVPAHECVYLQDTVCVMGSTDGAVYEMTADQKQRTNVLLTPDNMAKIHYAEERLRIKEWWRSAAFGTLAGAYAFGLALLTLGQAAVQWKKFFTKDTNGAA